MTASLPKTMKAAQYHPEDNKIYLEEIPVPQPKDDEILIRTIAASLCHSDLMLVLDALPPPPKPTTIGHEATGEIVAVGSKVQGFKVGDKIGFINAYRACFNCSGCSSHYLYCSNKDFQMQGFVIDGYFQEYSIIDPGTAIVLPEGMDATKAAPLFCAGITAYHGVTKAGLKPGQWMAIIGCGGLGQLAIRYAKTMQLKVIAVDVDDKVLSLAEEAGVEHTFNSRSNPKYLEELHSATNGGADAVVVFTAVKAGYDCAPKTLRIGGNLVCVGCPPNDVAFSAMDIAFEKYHVLGASNHATPAMLKEFAQFSLKHGIESPSRFYEIDQIERMVDCMLQHKTEGNRLAVVFSRV